MPKRTIVALFAVFAAGAVLAQAYKWVDKDGVVHYSDRPQDGAEQVQLPTSQPRPVATIQTPATQSVEAVAEAAAPFKYESLSVASPSAEETLWNIEGTLDVSLNLQPALQRGHKVRVYFDGSPIEVSGSSFQIEEVYRGVHNLQAEVLDETGALMIRSVPSRFYVQQNSIVGGN